MLSKASTHKPYPYDIPPAPQVDSITFERRDLWNALEFIRIEALLRSKIVWALYRKASQRKVKAAPEFKSREHWLQQHVALFGQNKFKLRGESSAAVRPLLGDETLRDRFAIGDGWAVLLGTHHRHLPFRNAFKYLPFWISDGIVDLSAMAKARERIPEWTIQLKDLQVEQTHYLYLRIDNAVEPQINLKELGRLLQERHKARTVVVGKPAINPITGEYTFPFHPRKDPPIRNILAWLKYFQCYDLRKSGLSIKETADRVYPNANNSTAKVKSATKRVQAMIQAAQNKDWPPKKHTS